MSRERREGTKTLRHDAQDANFHHERFFYASTELRFLALGCHHAPLLVATEKSSLASRGEAARTKLPPLRGFAGGGSRLVTHSPKPGLLAFPFVSARLPYRDVAAAAAAAAAAVARCAARL